MPVSQNLLKQQTARQLLSLLGLGAATGIGARSLVGMKDLLQPTPEIPVHPSSNIPLVMNIGKPAAEERARATVPQSKVAGVMDGLLQHIRNAGPAVTRAADSTVNGIAKVLPDITTTKPLASEWGMPLGAAVAGGGAAAGYGAIDWLLNKQRQQANDSELEQAYTDYNNSLRQRYIAAMRAKSAADTDDCGLTELSTAYCSLKTPPGLEKKAVLMSLLGKLFPSVDQGYSKLYGHDRWQAIKGGVNTAALAAALGSGTLTYDWAKGQNKQELLAQALKTRELQRSRSAPPPLLAQLTEDESNGNAVTPAFTA